MRFTCTRAHERVIQDSNASFNALLRCDAIAHRRYVEATASLLLFTRMLPSHPRKRDVSCSLAAATTTSTPMLTPSASTRILLDSGAKPPWTEQGGRGLHSGAAHHAECRQCPTQELAMIKLIQTIGRVINRRSYLVAFLQGRQSMVAQKNWSSRGWLDHLPR